jgi:cytochrome P450 family 110
MTQLKEPLNKLKEPPVVEMHPMMQLIQWTIDPLKFMEECERRYGDCFYIRLGSDKRALFISHPDAVGELFAPGISRHLDSGKGQLILRMVLGKHSSMLSDGEEHRRTRQLVTPAIHGERMRDYGDRICEATTQATQDWVPGDSVTIMPVLREVTLQIIFKTVLGIHGTERDVALSKAIRKFLNNFTSPLIHFIALFLISQDLVKYWNPNLKFSKLRSVQDELNTLLLEEIQERRATQNIHGKDVLSMLLSAKDEEGNPMGDEEIRDELLTLLFAGHDSSAMVFSWAIYRIHAHPEVRDRLLAELDSLGDHPNPMDIARLPYLTAVCSESMRIRSAVPASSTRINSQPITIQGYEFPPETVIVPSHHLTHHRPDLYPNPTQFNPDRFLERQFSPSEYYPYGGGSRRCIGAAFASFQMKLVVATILRQYTLELVDQRPIKTERRGVNVAPKGGVKMRVTGIRSRAQTN